MLSPGAYVSHLANDLLVLSLTGSLITTACRCLAGAYGCNMEKARGLGRHRIVLICVYFEYDNMNKHKSDLGGYWLSVFLAHHFSAINIWKQLGQFCVFNLSTVKSCWISCFRKVVGNFFPKIYQHSH